MKAIYFEQFGDNSVLKQGEQPTPAAGKGEVLVRIRHTSVNPVDWKIRNGWLQGMMPHVMPIIPGWDVAGEIAAVGEGVTGWRAGEAVYAYGRKPTVQGGTYAEYITLPASYVSRAPAGLSSAEAAAIPLVGLTAWQALFGFAELKSGEKLLILGGAGGTGSMAIQFARAFGADVTATTSPANRDYVESLGANHIVDYRDKEAARQQLKTIAPSGFDVVFDAVGGEEQAFAWEFVRKNGRLVSIVDTPNSETAKRPDVKSGFIFVEPNGSQLAEISALIAQRKVRAPAVREMSVTQAGEALAESEGRRVRGKVALKIDFSR